MRRPSAGGSSTRTKTPLGVTPVTTAAKRLPDPMLERHGRNAFVHSPLTLRAASSLRVQFRAMESKFPATRFTAVIGNACHTRLIGRHYGSRRTSRAMHDSARSELPQRLTPLADTGNDGGAIEPQRGAHDLAAATTARRHRSEHAFSPVSTGFSSCCRVHRIHQLDAVDHRPESRRRCRADPGSRGPRSWPGERTGGLSLQTANGLSLRRPPGRDHIGHQPLRQLRTPDPYSRRSATNRHRCTARRGPYTPSRWLHISAAMVPGCRTVRERTLGAGPPVSRTRSTNPRFFEPVQDVGDGPRRQAGQV